MKRWHGFVAIGTALVLAALAWWWTERAGNGGDPVPTAPTGASPPAAAPAPAPTETATPGAPPTAARTEAVPGVARSAPQAPNFAQGLRGLVVDEGQRPLAGLGVYLVDSAVNAPLAMPLLRRQHDALGPAASTETAADGTFAVGLPVAQDRFYELYVLSPEHATTRLGGLRLLAGEWHDVGTLTMTAGASLRGRVSVGGRNDLPVPGASVTVEIGAVFADAALRTLPGANQGLSATTDADGRYELHHVPSRGVVQVVAVASGFARARRPDIELRPGTAVEVDFALLPGQTLGGIVVDDKGNGIAEARIEAWPQKAAGDALIGHSDTNGHFDVLGLQPGPHRVRVLARGYDTVEQRDLEAGRADLRFPMQEQSRLRVRVLTPRGETLRSYQLALRRAFRDQPAMIAAVVDVPEQRVRLDGMTDYAEVRDVPPGLFRCQIEADGFAKTLSAEIDNERRPNDAPGPRALEIVVTMSTGASLLGRVVDETGAVLAGAAVSTQPAGTMPDNPIARMLAGAVPDVISRTRATTATDGTFTLPQLALGDYQLLVEHDAVCRTIVRDVRLDREGDRVLAPIVMVTGAQVTGRATVAGRVVGQIKVVLSTPANLANAAAAMRQETVTDAAGNFRMPRRVPPGTYELRAAVVGTSEPEAQAFRQLLQLQRSAVTVEIPRGSRQIERDIDLPSAN